MPFEIVALCDQLTRLGRRILHEFCDDESKHLVYLIPFDPSSNGRVGGFNHQFRVSWSLPAVHSTSADPWDIQISAVDCRFNAPQNQLFEMAFGAELGDGDGPMHRDPITVSDGCLVDDGTGEIDWKHAAFSATDVG